MEHKYSWHSLDPQNVISVLVTNHNNGLSNSEVTNRHK